MPQPKKSPDGHFSERLRGMMEAQRLKGKDLATMVDVSPTAVSRYLAGRTPSSEELLSIASALGVTMEWLMCGDDAGDTPELGEPMVDYRPARKRARTAVRKIRDLLDDVEAEL